ncbi:hypothetical protein IQ07DRAFT_671648 [Pyrenochaeta sp. DS3sAY3a]|nr:hypothetical protein IQ07DRAFT_671648 [Pyrenochaeta sp. DS3sAY3a]
MSTSLGLNAPTPAAHGLAALPNEILQQIAWECSHSRDALHLAMANKQVHEALSGVLQRKLVLTRKSTWRILQGLQDRPDLGAKVKEVSLSDFECPRTRTALFYGRVQAMQNLLAIEQGTFSADPEVSEIWLRIAREMDKYSDYWWEHDAVWEPNEALCLDILLHKCPNITSITMELPETFQGRAPKPPRNRGARIQGRVCSWPFQNLALPILQAQLKVLIIKEDFAWQGPLSFEATNDLGPTNNSVQKITLGGFTKLQHLELPASLLGNTEWLKLTGDPTRTPLELDELKKCLLRTRLPLTIKYLRLTNASNNTEIFGYLSLYCIEPRELLEIEHIELDFTYCATLELEAMHIRSRHPTNHLAILGRLAEKGIKVTWNFGRHQKDFDLRRVMEEDTKTSPKILWSIQMWFLDTGMTSDSEALCGWITPDEAQEHEPVFPDDVHLMSRRTFKYEDWTVVAFFHANEGYGCYPDDEDEKDDDDEEGDDFLCNALKVLWRRRFNFRLPKLFDLSEYEFGFVYPKAMRPLPAVTQFLGGTFHTPPPSHRAPSAVWRNRWGLTREDLVFEDPESEEERLSRLEAEGSGFKVQQHRFLSWDVVQYIRFDATRWENFPWKHSFFIPGCWYLITVPRKFRYVEHSHENLDDSDDESEDYLE